jgi:hypothetical protein
LRSVEANGHDERPRHGRLGRLLWVRIFAQKLTNWYESDKMGLGIKEART